MSDWRRLKKMWKDKKMNKTPSEWSEIRAVQLIILNISIRLAHKPFSVAKQLQVIGYNCRSCVLIFFMLEMSLSLLLQVPKHTPKENMPFFSVFPPSPPVLVAAVRVSPCHSRQPSVISDASALEGDRSSTPSDINSPRHRTHSLCNVRAARRCAHSSAAAPQPQCSGCFLCLPRPVMLSLCISRSYVVERVHEWQHSLCHTLSALPALPLTPVLIPPSLSFPQSLEDLEEAKRKKKKEKMGLGSLSRVFTRGKQRKSLDPGLFDGTSTPEYYIEEDADW